MTVYRGMDIGTAKPTPAEQSRIRHHLLDILDPQDEFSLADFLRAAEAACRDIISRNRVPLFVGGTGLYLRGLLRGVFEGPAADWSIRRRLEGVFRNEGPQALHDRLRRVDSASAHRLHPNDERRVIRALEVFELTGRPLSDLQQQGPRPLEQRPAHVYWISSPRDWLYRRIDARVENMFADGLLVEVQNLLAHPVPLSHTARQALGYKEIIDWLEGMSPLDAKGLAGINDWSADERSRPTLLSIQTRTRQFAKRQHTWFRNLEECRPIAVSGDETPEEIADLVEHMSHNASA